MKMTALWDMAPCSPVVDDRRFRGTYYFRHQVVLTMAAVRTYETSVDYGTTQYRIPEVCHFHSCCRENLKSH
jgi:hypothetical protein